MWLHLIAVKNVKNVMNESTHSSQAMNLLMYKYIHVYINVKEAVTFQGLKFLPVAVAAVWLTQVSSFFFLP